MLCRLKITKLMLVVLGFACVFFLVNQVYIFLLVPDPALSASTGRGLYEQVIGLGVVGSKFSIFPQNISKQIQ